jgi:hypothetical protein
MVPALGDHGRAADQYRPHHLGAGGEHISIEPGIFVTPGEIGMRGGQRDDVGAPAGLERSDAAPERLGATR